MSKPKDEYISPCGNTYTGVKIYTGVKSSWGSDNAPDYYGVIRGGNENHYDPNTGETYRGILMSMEYGPEVWIKRDVFTTEGFWWVRSDDPAIKEQKWFEIQ